VCWSLANEVSESWGVEDSEGANAAITIEWRGWGLEWPILEARITYEADGGRWTVWR
jgi:hypothetical protein